MNLKSRDEFLSYEEIAPKRYFLHCEKGTHEIQSEVIGRKTDIYHGTNTLAMHDSFFSAILGLIKIFF